MNKGLSLIEVLTAIVIISIILVTVFSFIQTGYMIFKNEYDDFLTYNSYRELIGRIGNDLKQIKKIIYLDSKEFRMLRKDDHTAEYKVIEDNGNFTLEYNGQIIPAGAVHFTGIRFEGRDKNDRISYAPEEMIFIKIFFSFRDRKGRIDHNFEIYETGML